MKKIFCLLLLVSIFILTGCTLKNDKKTLDRLETIKEKGKITIGINYDSKPFGFLNQNGDPDGFDIDVAKNIAKYILDDENAINFVETKGYNSTSLVASGEVDFLIAATTITPQRQLTVDFSEPYYTTGQAVLVPKNSKIVRPKDLNHKNVIVQLNSTAERTPKKVAPYVILMRYKSHKTAFEEFKSGKGDAIISDEALLKGFLMDNPSEYKILPFKLSIEPYGIVLQNSPEASSLKMAVNNALEQMKSDGTLNKLKTKWGI